MLYFATATMLMISSIVSESDRRALEDGDSRWIIGGVAVMWVCFGFLGFLQKVLVVPRSWQRNLLSVGLHQCAASVPVALMVLAMLISSARAPAGGAFTAVGNFLEPMDGVVFEGAEFDGPVPATAVPYFGAAGSESQQRSLRRDGRRADRGHRKFCR